MDGHLVRILQQLSRQPLSQIELSKRIGLSKSRINFYIKHLIGLKLIKFVSLDRESKRAKLEGTGSSHMSQKLLSLVDNYCYVLRATHSENDFYIELLALGSYEPLGIRHLSPSSSLEDTLSTIKNAVESLLAERNIVREQVKLMLFSTKATVEHGFNGTMYRNNIIEGSNIQFASHVQLVTGIPTYVCNAAFGCFLSLKHHCDIENALVLLCGEGTVSLGIFLNGKLLFGPNNSFVECTHLPYEHGIERSLGQFGVYTADALFWTVQILSLLLGVNRIIVAGPTFSGHLDTLMMVQKRLRNAADLRMQRLEVEYHESELTASKIRHELCAFAFEEACNLIEPKPLRKESRAFYNDL